MIGSGTSVRQDLKPFTGSTQLDGLDAGRVSVVFLDEPGLPGVLGHHLSLRSVLYLDYAVFRRGHLQGVAGARLVFRIDPVEEVGVLDRRGLGRAVITFPGVFSDGWLDEGNRYLLDHFEPAAVLRALDLGCGSGILGAFLASRHPEARVDFVDFERHGPGGESLGHIMVNEIY